MKRTFYRPKLEAGPNATEWQPCSTYTGSLIRQTHDSILLEVDSIVSGATSGLTSDIAALKITSQAISGSVSHLEDAVSGHTEQIGQLVVTAQAISGSVSSISDTVSGHTEQIGSLTLQASGFTVSIQELEKNEYLENILPQNGWKNKDGEFVEPTDLMLYSASASTITSPIVYMDAGDYVLSNYNADSNYFAITLNDVAVTPTSAYTVSTDTYQSCTRKVQHFTLNSAGNLKLVYGDNSHNSNFYRPKLEKGNTLTAYTNQTVQYNSLINQTSQQITLEVTEQITENDAVAQFKRTGIDITNGKIEIDAENTYINGNLELRAQDDADALTLLDDNGIERATITSQEIGALSGQSMSTTQTWDYTGNLDYGDSTNIVLGTKAFTANSKVTSGQQYGLSRVGYVILSYYDNNQWKPQYITSPNSCTIAIKLINTADSTISYTLPATQATYAGDRYWLESIAPSSNTPITITTGGTYNIVASITWANNTQTSPFARTTRYQIWGYMQVDAVTKSLVGADGLYSTNGQNNYMQFSKDGFHACDTSDSNNIIISSCGAAVSDKINPGGGQPIQTVDKWLDNEQKHTGPAHIANFKTGGEHWNLAQSYANLASVNRTSGLYTESSPYIPLPSTDIILVENSLNDNTVVYIDMAPMEFHGHIVTIRNFEYPLNTVLKSSNNARFHWPKEDGFGYTNQLEFGWGSTFPAEVTVSGDYPATDKEWSVATFIYQDITGSSSYGTENGRWICLNLKTYEYHGQED